MPSSKPFIGEFTITCKATDTLIGRYWHLGQGNLLKGIDNKTVRT